MDDLNIRLNDDFSRCDKITMDVHCTTKNNDGLLVKNPFKFVQIQNFTDNVWHMGVVANNIGLSYKSIPYNIESFGKKCLNSVQIETTYMYNPNEVTQNNELLFSKIVFLYVHDVDFDKDEAISYFRKNGLKLHIRDDEFRKNEFENRKPDIFICHDSRDKDGFVEPLYRELTRRYLKVWYDKYSIQLGDSLTEKIEEGILNCRYGIIVLSKNLLSNEKWTKNELQSFKIRQIVTQKKVILPIWYGIDESDLIEHSLWLLDKLAAKDSEGIPTIADKIKELCNQ